MPFTELMAISFLMAAGAYGAGVLPLAFALSERVKRVVSVFGAGLLVGTALIVIIPEGIHQWYDAQAKAKLAEEAADAAAGHAGHNHGHEGHDHESTWQIGASLVSGFALMLIVDRLGGAQGHGHSHLGGGGDTDHHAHSHAHSRRDDGDDGDAALVGAGDGKKVVDEDVEAGAAASLSDGDTGPSANDLRRNKAAMVGLLFHSAADGVAMGAACFARSSGMEAIIFFAIMLHKMPAALGFSSYLTQQNIPQDELQRMLATFALSAPAGAIGTYFLLTVGVVEYAQTNLAICLMVSGGTFLYVAAAHILPEVQAAGQLEARPTDNKPAAPSPWSDVWVMVAGMVLPLLINVEHSH